jgi:hypothetical protein
LWSLVALAVAIITAVGAEQEVLELELDFPQVRLLVFMQSLLVLVVPVALQLVKLEVVEILLYFHL